MMRRLILAAAACLSLAGAARAETVADLQILATSDLHMHLIDYDYAADRPDEAIGLNRVATLISAARAANPNTLLFDNGDTIQGSAMGDVAARVAPPQGEALHPATLAMNLIGYDAAVLGNHEFNYGLDFLERAYRGAAFPVLGGNILTLNPDGSAGPPLRPASVLLTREVADRAGGRHTLKIGVVGVLTPQIMIWDKDKLEGRVTAVDQVETARTAVAALRDAGADVVVVLTHSGLTSADYVPGIEQAARFLAALPGVDAVISGHSHRVFPGPDYEGLPEADLAAGTVSGTPVVMPGAYGSHLGVIALTLTKADAGWTVSAGRAEARPVRVRGEAAAAPDPRIAAALSGWHDRTLAYIREPIGAITARVSTYTALLGDVAALRLIADAQIAYAGRALAGTEWAGLPILSAAAPFRAGGRPGPDFYTDIAEGPVTIRNMADLYVFPNVLTVVAMTGDQVREWLEKSASVFAQIDPAASEPQDLMRPVPAYNFDVLFGGLTYTIDVTQPARYGREAEPENPDARRILDLKFNGEPLDPAQRFVIVTNNYRSNGGGRFPGLGGETTILTGADPNRDALIAWAREQGTITPDGAPVFRFAPVPGSPDIRFRIGPAGADIAAADPRLSKVAHDEAGFDIWRVDLSGGR